MFLLANQKKKRYRWCFLRLKANKKGTPDLFTGSTDLKKVSLIHLEVKMLQERYQITYCKIKQRKRKVLILLLDGKAHL